MRPKPMVYIHCMVYGAFLYAVFGIVLNIYIKTIILVILRLELL